MFEYLSSSIDPVVEGLEDFEKIYALEQAWYIPVRTLPGVVKEVPAGIKALPGEGGESAITRWKLTPAQRQMIADGADIMLEVVHFGGPLAPVRMMVAKPAGGKLWNQWFCSQTNGPYWEELKEKPE